MPERCGCYSLRSFDKCLVNRCNRYDFILSDFLRCDFTAFFMFSVLCETLHTFCFVWFYYRLYIFNNCMWLSWVIIAKGYCEWLSHICDLIVSLPFMRGIGRDHDCTLHILGCPLSSAQRLGATSTVYVREVLEFLAHALSACMELGATTSSHYMRGIYFELRAYSNRIYIFGEG